MLSYSIEYLDYITRVVEVNSNYISQLKSEIKPLEKNKLVKLYYLKYIRDYIIFSKIHDLLNNEATLLDLLDNSYLEQS